jgi:hypothetical protein
MTTLFMRVYSIINDAVEKGVNFGMYRAHKHTSTPSEDDIKEAIQSAVMDELTEVIDFDKYEIIDSTETDECGN